ncbi:hypothetical protein IAR55_005586 [Kwoniella newhampshirensis]|uniref:Uncharacterized protein n=1 Tax=Kwoniella newhampshirensis TaxID=1651941 RepID=A0AAW0YHR6_9TREE
MDPNPREDTIARLQSNWTWVPDWIDASNAGEAARLVTFRRQVVIDKTPPECLVRLSADTRYKLSVNSERVCVGPSRGSDKLWFYDTVDLASHLKVGKNVIIIQVLRFFNNVVAGIPFARNAMPGLTILGQINGQDISTGRQDTEWEGRVEDGVYYPTGSKWDIFLHTYERVQSSAARQWQKLQRYRLIGHFGILSPWRLRPRMIPLAETTVAPFKAVRDAQSEHSAQEWTEFFHGQPLTLAPGTKHRVEVEYTTHSTAFVRLSASRAHSLGSKVSFTYSEAYQPQPNGRKGDRTKREGQGLSGPSDTYEFSGNGNGEVESYEPFWWKTFRFLVVEIEVGPDPLELLAFEATQTNYPMDVTAVWNGGSDEMDKMWEVSVRTMRNCMFDGYSDCPFYEQLQ